MFVVEFTFCIPSSPTARRVHVTGWCLQEAGRQASRQAGRQAGQRYLDRHSQLYRRQREKWLVQSVRLGDPEIGGGVSTGSSSQSG